jgi:hypothetical protein
VKYPAADMIRAGNNQSRLEQEPVAVKVTPAPVAVKVTPVLEG